MVRVSVLVTVYNAAPYLREALQSVFAQDYPDIELCVVDDGSTDGSAAIVAELATTSPFPMHWQTQANRGQAAALNEAFSMSTGDVIALLDGDDWWLPTKVREMVEYISLCPGGGVYQHQVDVGAGKGLRAFAVSGDLFGKWRELGTVNPVVHQDWCVLNMPSSGLMFTRQVYEQIGNIPEEIVVNPDFWLFVLGCSLGPLYTHPRILGSWRQHPRNSSRNPAYSFKRYWLKVLFPRINEELARRGHAVKFAFIRTAVLWQPLALINQALRRRHSA